VELERVLPEPRSAAGASLGLGEPASFAQSSGRFAGGSQSTELPVLCDSAAHPVDLGVAGDGLVVRIDHDDLEVFVGGVLSNPVGVKDTQSLDPTSDTFLGNGLQVPLRLLLLDSTRGLRLAVWAPLGNGAFAASAAHGNAVDDEALLVLVTQTASLVGTGGSWGTVDLGQLAVLPAANAEQVAHHIALFLAIQL